MKTSILSTLILIAALNCNGESDSTFIPKTNYPANYCQYFFEEQQYIADSIANFRIIYGLEINQFSTNSGFKPGIELSIFAGGREDNKSFELALFLDTESKMISGLSFHHKYLFMKNKKHNRRLWEPYFLYNFIARRTILNEPLAKDPEFARRMGRTGKTTYISFEHHIGLGVQWNITSIVYLHANLAFGCFLGSIKKPFLASKATTMYAGGNGWGVFSKFGFGIEL